MMRKPLAVAIVLLLAGFAPAVAIVGFCQTMPCCHQGAETTASEANDCCPTISCDETPSANVSAPTVMSSPAVAPSTTIVLLNPPKPRRIETSSPPPTPPRSRLAILSTLLI